MSLETERVSEYGGRFYRDGITVGGIEISPDGLWGGLTVLPVILLYLVVAVIPIGFAVFASLHRIPLANPEWTYVGLSNYTKVFQIDRFWASLWRGAVFMVGSTIIQTVVGIWMALVVNKISRGQRILSTLVFSAYLIPTVIVTLIALFMLDPFVGVLHTVGTELGLWKGYLLGDAVIPWWPGALAFLAPLFSWWPSSLSVHPTMWAVILIGSWKFSVFITIFALAQLRSIPERFYEAAKICGATTWEMFRDITLPRIKGALLVAVLLRSIFMFNKFDIIYQLTGGGPGYATTTLPVLAYRETFVRSAYGLGNAIAIVMFLFLAVGAFAYFFAFNPSEEVET